MNYNKERLNIFFKNQWLSMGGVAVPTFIVLYLLLKDDKIYLFSSFALVVLTFIPRIMIMKKYQKTLNEKLENIYSVWVFLSSVITSLIILYFYPKGDFELISLLVAYLAGMTAGAITTLGSSLIIYRLYAIPQLLTLSLSLLYYGNNERYYLLALSVIVYMAIMLKTSKNYYENLIGKIKLEETLYENLRFKSIDNILDTISHKINNPLSIVFMSIDGLKRKNIKEEEKEKYIRYIEDASNRVSSIGNIYDEFKTDQISLVKTNIHEVLKGISVTNDNVYYINKLKNIHAKIDKDILIKTIELLIKNSNEANSKKINLSLSTDQDFITIKIEDDGDGVNKNDLPHLFLPFYSTKSLDRGLGLNFAKKYIESMKGEISCEENKGSRGVSFLIKFKL